MKLRFTIRRVHLLRLLVLTWAVLQGVIAVAQQDLLVDMSRLDGRELTPDNVLNFQIHNTGSVTRDVRILGTVVYRRSKLRFSYSCDARLYPGVNSMSHERITALQWQFPQQALRELFFNYKRLPQGIYEYCVRVVPRVRNSEATEPEPAEDCIYKHEADLFLIQLLEPENNARLHEQYPLLSWVVSYPFASELSYRLRVAPLQEGQSNNMAITRNNPVFQDNAVRSTSMVYPVTATPLQKFQPYVWTVDAYYKGILLGGAEPWRFTIVDDSLLKGIPRIASFVDLTREEGRDFFYAIGELKLKYVVEDGRPDTLTLRLTDKSGKNVPLARPELPCVYGDNRFVLDLREKASPAHLAVYRLKIVSRRGKQYELMVKYVNPDFL